MNTDWKRNATLFLASQTISLFGTALVQYAITWSITLETQSGVMVALSIICGFLPTFFLSPFSGVWADRYPRKTLIILADSLIAVATLVLAVLFKLGYGSIWMLLAISAVRATGSGIQAPAVGAFLPQFVPEDKLMKVNSANSSIQSLVMLVSPMVSGALMTKATLEAILLIDVVTAAIAVLILAVFLRVPAHAKASGGQPGGYMKDLREGFAYIKRHDYILRYFLFCVGFFILSGPVAFLTPLQVARTFGEDVWRLSAIEVTFSVGMMLGGTIMAVWGGLKNKVHTMGLSYIVVGLFTLALGIVPVFWVYLAFMALIGVAIPAFNTPAIVLLQQKVEDSFRGRVFGVRGMLSSSMMPLGMLIFGPIADAVRIEWLLIGTGLAMSIMGLLMLGDRVMIEAGRPATGA
ncbi:MAG: MFS transporter [Bacillota bacterium]|jgi:DHA3 family macrolide efflux protein-like MFS transporter